MLGHVIASHGLESGPNAAKVTALAAAATALGWSCERPDFLACDRAPGHGPLGDVDARIAQLRALAGAAKGPLVLAGSSMGAFISARVSLEVPCAGLFLLAPPPALQGFAHRLEAAAVPTWIIHGWGDELIRAQNVVDWARPRRDRLLLVDDDHRLSKHVAFCAQRFDEFLRAL
ncbi:MAG: alpha/beta fold hydrolase [Proteobacteria bacterium]|nr:alpha/beta fold hydrolase [Pseudomonadota bacterium]MBS0463950.1 alpha/beta fold hydrolase [Pseudomonadota bacterium]